MQKEVVIKGKQEYILQNKIEYGGSTDCYLALEKSTQHQYVVKNLKSKINHSDEDDMSMYLQKDEDYAQRVIDEGIKHDNLVNILEIIVNSEKLETYQILEYCNQKNLFNYIIDNPQIDDIKFIKISLDIARGLQYLQSKGIVHRDIKTECILLHKLDRLRKNSAEENQEEEQKNDQEEKDNFICKISDFDNSSFQENFNHPVGTINYMAPEIVNGKQYGKEVDIWSYGCVLHELVFRSQLFKGSSIMGIAKKIQNFQRLDLMKEEQYQSFVKEIKGSCDDFFKNLISQCLNPNPEMRVGINEIVSILEKQLVFQKQQKLLQQQKEQQQQEELRQQQLQKIQEKQKKLKEQEEELQMLNLKKQEEYLQYVEQLKDCREITPNQNQGFFKKIISKFFYNPTVFEFQNEYFVQISQKEDIFYFNLFHFLVSGQLLLQLQKNETLIKNKNIYTDNNEITLTDNNDKNNSKEIFLDSFQFWVSEIIYYSKQIEVKHKEQTYDILRQVLTQISNIKDILFRINSYLGWLKDNTFIDQAISLISFMNKESSFHSNILSKTSIEIVDSEENVSVFVEQAGLCECLVIYDILKSEYKIIMQRNFLEPLFNLEIKIENTHHSNCQSEKNEDGGIQQLLNQFKSTFITQNYKEFYKNIFSKSIMSYAFK